MDQRRWEELDMDILLNVFGRVEMESLLLDVPFVSKSWYKASLNPSCWKDLTFPVIEIDPFNSDVETEYCWKFDPFFKRFVHDYRIEETRFSVTSFIKFVVSRSKGCATSLRLPAGCSKEALKYVADECPGLKKLSVSDHESSTIAELIGKWKHLEWLLVGECSSDMEKILSQISIHCKNFSSLLVPDAFIGKDEALAIVNLVPNIKFFMLRWANIDRANLITLLRGCKELVALDARNCVGFDENDDEISKLASHIANFSCGGSRALDCDELGNRFAFDEMLMHAMLVEKLCGHRLN